jgi:di/tricarboxylate transporter
MHFCSSRWFWAMPIFSHSINGAWRTEPIEPPLTPRGTDVAIQLAALVICVAVLTIGLYRGVNVGILMFVAACAVGLWLADMPIDDVIAGYPVDLLILLAGVTFFFGVAQATGTVDRLLDAALHRLDKRTAFLPLGLFGLTAAVGSMGNPATAFVVFPIGMNVADKKDVDPVLMAIAMGTGMSAGAFAPTSMFGVIVYGTARDANIALNPMLLFAVALVVNVALLAVAYLLFGRSRRSNRTLVVAEHAAERRLVTIGGGESGDAHSTVGAGDGLEMTGEQANARTSFTFTQKITIVSLSALVCIVFVATALGASPEIGVISFALGGLLMLLDPKAGAVGIGKIDWSTILLVGGILTYVGVLAHVGTTDLLGDFAASMSVPLIAAVVICFVGGLVSVFASTTGMLAVVVPLAIPLVMSGGIPGWALICAVGICASIVDVSPFSSIGATMVATTPDSSEHPRMTRLLMRWGLSLIVIGPVVMIGGLVVPSMLL